MFWFPMAGHQLTRIHVGGTKQGESPKSKTPNPNPHRKKKARDTLQARHGCIVLHFLQIPCHALPVTRGRDEDASFPSPRPLFIAFKFLNPTISILLLRRQKKAYGEWGRIPNLVVICDSTQLSKMGSRSSGRGEPRPNDHRLAHNTCKVKTCK